MPHNSDAKDPLSMNTQDNFEVGDKSSIQRSTDDVRSESPTSQKKNNNVLIFLSTVTVTAVIAAAAYYTLNLNPTTPEATVQETPIETPQAPEFDPKKARIERLLSKAETYMQQGQFVAPIGQNAFGKYESILRIDSQNFPALAGMQKIADHFLQLTLNHIEKKQLNDAQSTLEQAKAIYPSAEGINDIEQTLLALLASENASANQKSQRAALAAQKARKAAQEKAWAKKQADKLAQQQLLDEAARLAADQAAQEKFAEEARLLQESQASSAQKRLAKLRVDGLLNKADTYFKRKEFYAPEEENALNKYSQVIAIDPNNAEAQKGINLVIMHMLPTIETQLENKHFSQAKNLFDLAKAASS